MGAAIGLLSSLFSTDWAAELDRAEELLERGETVRALDLARKARKRTDGELAKRATALVGRTRQELFASQLEKAETAEAEGDYEDAADWLLAAIEQLERLEESGAAAGGDGAADRAEERSELERRRQALLERAEDRLNPFVETAAGGGATADGTATSEIDHDARFRAFVQMLDAELAERYEERSEEFRHAVVELNEGRAETARETLDRLLDPVDGRPDDGILRLERGRAHLLTGDTERAREDLEVAWRELGDGPLDATDSLSVPRLWAEATLADERFDAVVERLGELADPAAGRTELCHLFATALLRVAPSDEALDYLGGAASSFPRDPRFPLLLAEVLRTEDRRAEAIEVLEASVGPACAGGSCSKKAIHPPSMRALAGLYVDQAGDGQGSDGEEADSERLERAATLMAMVAHKQNGMLGGGDHSVLARYYRAIGDTEAAAASEAEAERLAETGDEERSPAPPQLGSDRRVIL